MPIYNSLYEIICQYVYGTTTLTPFQDLVATECATVGSFVMVALPLICILLVAKTVLSFMSRW